MIEGFGKPPARKTRKTGFSLALERLRGKTESESVMTDSDSVFPDYYIQEQKGTIRAAEPVNYEPTEIRLRPGVETQAIDVGRIPSKQRYYYTSAAYASFDTIGYYSTGGYSNESYNKDQEIRYLQEKLAELEAQLENKKTEQVRLNPNLFTDDKIGPSRAISFDDEDQKDGYLYNGENK